MTFDPRTIATPVYQALQDLRIQHDNNKTRLKAQKSQAVELYTYLATWGMMRLKAEEKVLSQDHKEQHQKDVTKQGREDIVKEYFKCLGSSKLANIPELTTSQGLETIKQLSTDEYLGLTGLGLEIAQEFSFWANAIYHDITGEQ